MQHYFIYPEAKASKSKELLSKKGYSEADFKTFDDMAKTLEDHINNIGCTLLSCDFRTKGSFQTIWNIKISTPGHCDIFTFLDAIRQAFDMNGIDEQFTYINTSYNNKEVYIEFTHES